MVPALLETKENPDRAVRELEPPPAKMKKKTRLAVSIRRGKLCYIPVTSTESETKEPERLPTTSNVPPQSTGSS